MRLYDAISEHLDFDIDENMLEKTDAVYTETRYPGDIGMLPEGKPSHTAAKELYEFAEYIYNSTMQGMTKKE